VRAFVTSLGAASLRISFDAGGMALVLARVVRALLPPRLDRSELLRSLRSYGEQSLPIVAATGAFTGMIMVLQSAVYVEAFGVHNLVGWFTGFATFREVGPLLIGLMFSGRVGASNTSELATMRVTEQIDALRILAIDPYEALILPRTVSMVVALGGLVVYGNLVAVVAGALCARLLVDVEYGFFFSSLTEQLGPADFLIGVEKALLFGLVVAVVSTHFGLTARGGSTGVGRAVNAQVVACAVGLFLVDYFMTSVVR
jgi:phospholipid/cholesterol/gamma-HCH transport system permease protein